MVHSRVMDMTYIALFAVLIAVCSWIAVPLAVPFTLQTLAVFLSVGLLGGRRAAAATLLYILLGVVGLPVFAGFTAGPGILFGPLGGYLFSFPLMALVSGALMGRGDSALRLGLALLAGLLPLYAIGTAWYMIVYIGGGGLSLFAALGLCVFPFIIPDLLKIIVAVALIRRLAPSLPNQPRSV